ncbi:FmdB family regulatory protein [Candidatus Kinetoplastibacterium desouzaii TCC079E]|uniref:FmdB family regulatory protein n=2 Tax=Candidatus Kinetoplastidibacterium desouzai TaxID=994692 RepID=M1L3E3_9PROT|nr:FmdB family regulatory protein [Candidatus Kinetoplastibacterium desouzaii TCC079E]
MCGHSNEVLQKMNEDPIKNCPNCGKNSYLKQVTAPNFQLKGTGWYVTDFKNEKNNKSSIKEEVKANEGIATPKETPTKTTDD